MQQNKNTPSIRFAGFTDAWEQRKLGELCDVFRSGEFIKASDIYEDGAFPVYGGNGLRGYADRFNYDGNYALIGRQGALCGNMNFSSGKAYFTEHAVAVHANDYNNTRFLFYLLDTMNLGQYSAQSAQPGLAVNKLITLPALCPSKPEQETIAEFITRIDTLITLHQRKYDQLVNVKKSMLEKMFPKNGETVPEVRFAGFTDAWEQRKVGDFAKVLSAARVHKHEWTEQGVPFFRSSDVMRVHNGRENEKVYISQELFEELSMVSGRPEKDDIFITGGGSIGMPYIVPNDNPLYSKDADLLWIKKSENHNSQYLYSYFFTPTFRNYIASISHIGTIAHYTIVQVKETPVLLPKIREQEKIGSFFSNLDRLITLHQRKLERLQNIKKACLEKMFV